MTRISNTLAAAALLFGSGISYGQVIEFEGVAPDGDAAGPFTDTAPYFEDGLAIFSVPIENAIFDSATIDVNTNGSDVFGWCGNCESLIEVILITDTIPAFDLLSIDAVDLLFPGEITESPGDLEIEGVPAGPEGPTTKVRLRSLVGAAEWSRVPRSW